MDNIFIERLLVRSSRYHRYTEAFPSNNAIDGNLETNPGLSTSLCSRGFAEFRPGRGDPQNLPLKTDDISKSVVRD
jgi:hypothetical protein